MKRLGPMLLLLGGMAIGGFGVVVVGRAAAYTPPAAPPPPPPPPRHPQPTAAPAGSRFQYRCETNLSHRYWSDEVLPKLNQYAASGWRWMGFLTYPNNQDVYCFEKVLPPGAPQQRPDDREDHP